MSDEFDPPSWTDSSGVWHSGTRKAHAERMRGMVPGPGYPWHVDDNGCFWWGTPLARAERIANERLQSLAPLPLAPSPEPEAPAPDRGRER